MKKETHIQLSVRDLTRMRRFYDAILAELGLVREPEERAGEAGAIWCRADRRWPQFVLRAPLIDLPATCANGSQVSLARGGGGMVGGGYARRYS